MHIEFKNGGPLLMLDGVLTEEGLKRQQSGAIEFKVIDPPRDTASVARVRQRMADIQSSLDTMKLLSHVAPSHPVVLRGLRLLARRAEHATTSRA